jgi:hypothetical protein
MSDSHLQEHTGERGKGRKETPKKTVAGKITPKP